MSGISGFNPILPALNSSTVAHRDSSKGDILFVGNKSEEKDNKKSHKLLKAVTVATLALGMYAFLKKTDIGTKILDKASDLASKFKNKLNELLTTGSKTAETAVETVAEDGTKIAEGIMETTVNSGTKVAEEVAETAVSTGTKVTEEVTNATEKLAEETTVGTKKYPEIVDKFEKEFAEAKKKAEVEKAWEEYSNSVMESVPEVKPSVTRPQNQKKYPEWIDKFEREMAEKQKKREIEEAWRQYYEI